MRSKHDVMRIVDGVSIMMTLTSLYICNENKARTKIHEVSYAS